MRILTVCSQGNKRSVYTRFALNKKHDVIAMGVDVQSQETIKMLTEWADVILLAEKAMKKKIPTKQQRKIDEAFVIGPDIYPVSISGVLLAEVKIKVKKYL